MKELPGFKSILSRSRQFACGQISDTRKYEKALHEAGAEAYEKFVSAWALQHKYFLAARWGRKFNGLFLDYGCGTGVIARNLIGAGREIVGIDISRNMCRIVKKKFGAQVVVGDCLNLPFKDQAFSVVCISQMLHHVPDQLEGAFSEIGRCTEKAVCMFEPSTTPPSLILRVIWFFHEMLQFSLYQLSKLLYRLRKNKPEEYGKSVFERELNPERLRELCEKEGFEVSEMRFFNFVPLITFLPETLRKHLVYSMISLTRGTDVEIIAKRCKSTQVKLQRQRIRTDLSSSNFLASPKYRAS
jgi:ubiquinone/menaquinone biosynthesis C-methylase UbiE